MRRLLGRNLTLLRRVNAALLGLLLAAPALAQQVPPPTPVTPGASQPVIPPAPPPSRPAGESLFSIPSVAERPLEQDQGPRIVVSAFTLAGAHEHPDQSLSVATMRKVLDDALTAQPKEGYTVNQLQQIAFKVGALYREHGFILTQAFVPAQQVTNGNVTVQVLEGRLGAVRVEGNKHYRTSTIEAPFDAVRGTTVNQHDVEARLLRLSEYPGLSVFGVFTPGKAVGDSDLVLKVQHEKPVDFTLAADNFGNPFNGQYRGRAGLTLNSPLGVGDKLDLSYLRAFPQGSQETGASTNYYSADYRVPFAGGRTSVAAGYAKTDYAAGGTVQGLYSGDAKIGNLEVDVETSRSRQGRSYVYARFDSKRGELSQAVRNVTTLERLTDGEMGFAFDHADRSGRGQWLGSVSLLHGTNSEDAANTIRPESDSSYTVGRASIERLERLAKFHTLRFKLSGQYSSNALPTLEEAALGGPSSVRAYQVAEFLADKDLAATAEWYMGAPGFAAKAGPRGRPWGDVLQFVLFFDYGRGSLSRLPSVGGNFQSHDLKGYGAGIAFNLPQRAFLRLDVARPMGADTYDLSQVFYKKTRIYGTFGVTF